MQNGMAVVTLVIFYMVVLGSCAWATWEEPIWPGYKASAVLSESLTTTPLMVWKLSDAAIMLCKSKLKPVD